MDSGRRAPQARAIEKKRAILEAAVDIMFSSGLTRVTHRHVASRAGVPVGSIGYYFNTRDELLVHALEEIGNRRSAHARTLIDASRNAPEITDRDLAATLSGIYLPVGRDDYTGWVCLSLDCVRESGQLRDVVAKGRGALRDDIAECLAVAGKEFPTAELVMFTLDGAVSQAVLEQPAAVHAIVETHLLDLFHC